MVNIHNPTILNPSLYYLHRTGYVSSFFAGIRAASTMYAFSVVSPFVCVFTFWFLGLLGLRIPVTLFYSIIYKNLEFVTLCIQFCFIFINYKILNSLVLSFMSTFMGSRWPLGSNLCLLRIHTGQNDVIWSQNWGPCCQQGYHLLQTYST